MTFTAIMAVAICPAILGGAAGGLDIPDFPFFKKQH